MKFLLDTHVDSNGIEITPIREAHLHELPTMETWHKDPFDRLLIATATVEEMTLITADEKIHKYRVNWAW